VFLLGVAVVAICVCCLGDYFCFFLIIVVFFHFEKIGFVILVYILWEKFVVIPCCGGKGVFLVQFSVF